MIAKLARNAHTDDARMLYDIVSQLTELQITTAKALYRINAAIDAQKAWQDRVEKALPSELVSQVRKPG